MYCKSESDCRSVGLLPFSLAKPYAFISGATVISKSPSVSSENAMAELKLSMKIWLRRVSLLSFTLFSMELGFQRERVSSIALKMLSMPCCMSAWVSMCFRIAISSLKW